MRSFGILTCICLGLSACGSSSDYRASQPGDSSTLQARNDQAVVVTDEQLEKALEVWRQFEMPEPPADAPLAVVTHSDRSSNTSATRGIVFLVRPSADRKPAIVFTGTEETPVTHGTVEIRKTEPDAAQQTYGSPGFHGLDGVFHYNRSFAIGLQCWARGHRTLGRTLLVRSLDTGYSRSTRQAVWQIADSSIEEALASSVWGYWFNHLYNGGDLALIHRQLVRAVAAFPCLRPDDEHLKGYYSNLAAQVGRAAEPSTAPPDSVEALIDSLINVRLDLSNDYVDWVPMPEYARPPETLLRLALMGFAAVPALYAHRDDRRLTRCTSTPMFNGATAPMTVGELAVILLDNFSGQTLSYQRSYGGTWIGAEEVWTNFDKNFEAWWAGARQKGERKVMMELARTASPWGSVGRNDGSALAPLILGRKYPDALPELFTAVARKEVHANISALVEGIATGTADKAQKVKTLLAGLDSKEPWTQESALRGLARVDEAEFSRRLAALLANVSPKLQRPRVYRSDAVKYTRLVPLTTHETAWAAMRDLADRAEPGLRAYLLGQLRWFGYGPHSLDTRLAFIAGYLGDRAKVDPALDDEDGKPVWNSLRVAEIAALHLGAMLELDEQPKAGWSKSEWADFENAVRAALKQRGIAAPAKAD